MNASYAHVYLSPHLDDAVLSCGGLIHQQAKVGQRPLVITLFAGRPPADRELSPLAQLLHARWGGPDDMIAVRWAEDQAALTALKADYLRLDYPDCIYRGQESGGEWYYPSIEAIFGEVHPADERLPTELAAVLTDFIPRGEDTTLYAPLTVGNHVDHQLTFAAAYALKEQGWHVQFYEDYPYVETEGALSAALAHRGADRWQARVIPLTEEDLAAKIRAIACYRSQLDALFGGRERMSARVKEYTARVGGERLWLPD